MNKGDIFYMLYKVLSSTRFLYSIHFYSILQVQCHTGLAYPCKVSFMFKGPEISQKNKVRPVSTPSRRAPSSDKAVKRQMNHRQYIKLLQLKMSDIPKHFLNGDGGVSARRRTLPYSQVCHILLAEKPCTTITLDRQF